MDSEQIVIDSSLPDRISDLPDNIIIDCILDRIPILDVVATSILSKGWRHKWRRIPNLVFDDSFMHHVIKARRLRRGLVDARFNHEYSNIIGKILLLHLGPIHKFVLSIPYFCNGKSPLDLSSLMLFVSQNAVKKLIIEAENNWKVRLPSYIFQCNELQHLKLHLEEFYLHPPQDFSGFCNLLSLDLSGLHDGDEISNLVSKCPLLERLKINCYGCKHPVVIDAPRLLFLHAYYCKLNEFLKLENVCNLTAISLQFESPGRLNLCDLFDVFGSVPKVETVTLDPLQNIEAMPQDAPTSFPTTLHNHKSLTLLEIDISSPQCIYFVLCILKSSPNLQKLNLGILPSKTVEDEAALHLLEMETRETQTLNSLLTIKMKGLLGSKVGIMFVKMILSCSPVLKTMYLTGFADIFGPTKDILSEAEFTLMSELLKCPRSSCRAQITKMDSQQIVIDSSLPDRISNLPNNIITDCILDRIPIHDVVATSILSKGWRHKWRRIPNLVFDDYFVHRFFEARRLSGLGNASLKLEYSNIIGKILLLHLGPIHKFVLLVPYVWKRLPPDLSSWMLFVSQNEIKELTIEARTEWIVRVPSYVFQCNELRHLKLHLHELDLHPPQDFRGFCNLLSLDLSGILYGGESEISNLVSKCTLLERLSLDCTGCTHPVVIDAPRLLFLHAHNAFLKLKNVCSLTAISLQFSITGRWNLCDLFDVFGSVPKVETVTLRPLQYKKCDSRRKLKGSSSLAAVYLP